MSRTVELTDRTIVDVIYALENEIGRNQITIAMLFPYRHAGIPLPNNPAENGIMMREIVAENIRMRRAVRALNDSLWPSDIADWRRACDTIARPFTSDTGTRIRSRIEAGASILESLKLRKEESAGAGAGA